MRREVEVDTALAEIWGREQANRMVREQALTAIHRDLGEKSYEGRYGEIRWPTSTQEALEALWTKIASGDWSHTSADGRLIETYKAQQARTAIGRLEGAQVLAEELRAEAQPLETEYYANPWSRFFLVQNTGGHIHSSMNCATTFPTTQWSWLPELSGLEEDDAVEAYGPRLCSICYPSAPTEWTLGLPAKIDPKRCPGSSQIVEPTKKYGHYGQCPECDGHFALSSTGKLRPHHR
jgi:hypothetical protein